MGAPWSHYWAGADALIKMHRSGEVSDQAEVVTGANKYNVGGSGEMSKG